jgi:hypothetical protein
MTKRDTSGAPDETNCFTELNLGVNIRKSTQRNSLA